MDGDMMFIQNEHFQWFSVICLGLISLIYTTRAVFIAFRRKE